MRTCIFCDANISRGNNNKRGTCRACWAELMSHIARINKWRKQRGYKEIKNQFTFL